jgi:hypothetical protein
MRGSASLRATDALQYSGCSMSLRHSCAPGATMVQSLPKTAQPLLATKLQFRVLSHGPRAIMARLHG